MRETLKKYNIRPSKRLGQNFLIDKRVLRKIIKAAELFPKDIVLEIGPGLGILTIELAKRVKKVIAIEKDGRMCKILEEILKDFDNVEIVNRDVLKMGDVARPYVGRATSYIATSHIKVVANLPYYITSPVIRKFLEAKHKTKIMILMVQKEVAQRICAKPGKMSLLSVVVQFYAKPKIITYVSKKSFWPMPKVDSAIIKIIPQPIPKINTKKFFNLVKIGFSSKRKMLKNNLSSTLLEARKIEKILKKLAINPKARAENLCIKDWLNLYEKLKTHLKK